METRPTKTELLALLREYHLAAAPDVSFDATLAAEGARLRGHDQKRGGRRGRFLRREPGILDRKRNG